jgi:16S rRNA (uracil1498-N3)-methyltransferase
MRLTRIYVDTPLAEGMTLDLAPATASHLAKVLRARGGEDIVLFNGDGREFMGSVDNVRGSRVRATVGMATHADRESPLGITLVQCIPRGDRMDFIVQKATELGVRRIIPVLSQRSVVRLDERQASSKADHWRAVAVGACEQCGRNRLPDIDAPRKLLDYLGESPVNRIRLVLEPEAGSPAQSRAAVGATPMVPTAGTLTLDSGAPPALDPGAAADNPGIDVAIGPEGGFAPEELDAFRLAGFTRLTLGPRILRTETAAIVALAWLQSRYGDLR